MLCVAAALCSWIVWAGTGSGDGGIGGGGRGAFGNGGGGGGEGAMNTDGRKQSQEHMPLASGPPRPAVRRRNVSRVRLMMRVGGSAIP
eukprot:1793563-Prymnesium_polylepis.2